MWTLIFALGSTGLLETELEFDSFAKCRNYWLAQYEEAFDALGADDAWVRVLGQGRCFPISNSKY